MSTFIGQLFGFAVIVYLVWRFIVPLVGRLMSARQDTVRQQLADAAAAADRLAEASQAHTKALEDAKSEAHRVVEEARTDAERIAEQLEAQADVEAERIKMQGARQVDLIRAQLTRQLRLELGHESVRQARNWYAITWPIRHNNRPPSTASWISSMRWRRLRPMSITHCWPRCAQPAGGH